MKYTDVKTMILSPLGTNCYIVPTGGSEAVVIDPADEGDKIYDEAHSLGLAIRKILLTHGHFDHTGGLNRLKARILDKDGFDVPVYVHKSDEELLADPVKSLSFFCAGKQFYPCEATDFIGDGDVIEQGSLRFTVLHTPGHTAGSVCYLCEDEDGEGMMFAGDTLFKDSIGRSDTYSGDSRVQLDSLDRIKSLDRDYVIFTGHGVSTTLDAEKRFNPFLSDF